MADRTVRAIFEARVSGAQKGMRDLARDTDSAGKKVDGLTKDLAALGKSKVSPQIDVKITDAKKRLSDLTLQLADLRKMDANPQVEADIQKAQAAIREVRSEIKELDSQKAEVKVDASIKEAQKRLAEVTVELGNLRTLEATPEVTADISAAQKRMRDVKAELRDLNGAKAEMKVTADTSPAKKEIGGLADDVADAGDDAGDEAGQNIASGIIDALRTIPIAGAVIGVGVAIAGGILAGIVDGLSIEAERDLFSARTGLDEDTSARFGRAAGEAYANAWGDSVAANLDTARFALQAGIIDSDATDAEIQNVIAKLQGLSDLFDFDIASSVRGVGNLMKTGMAKDADEAFDLIVAASSKLPSDDLLDTLNEYSNQFVQLGIDGPKAFGLLVQAAKAGARDTDNVADTLKELGIRIREGTVPATDALKLLGLNAKDIVRAFQKGGPDAAAGVDKVFDALRKLEAKGGNTQAVVTNLFGGPGEDLGAALYALDIDKATQALNGAEGAAGAADRALTTMSDNTAAKMESAKRNVEVAMDGIKGALAEAFSDEIGGAADWVSKNRAPLMEFFLDIVNGAFDAAQGFVEFGASTLDVIASIAEGIAGMPSWLIGDDMKDAAQDVADAARTSADSIRNDIPQALEDTRAKLNGWAAPELLKAKVHDATIRMTEDFDTFAEKVNGSDVKVKINGDKANADQILEELIANINGQDGTVLINGDKVPAEEALDRILANIKTGEENVTIGADAGPAEKSLGRVKGKISAAEAAMRISADTTSAEESLIALRRKYSKMGIRVSGVSSEGGVHEGGWIARGLHAGGRVRGIDPGYDNVLWPLNTGGRTLVQPLAGGEYVVNSKDSAYWAPLLEWINGGGRPTTHTEDNRMPITIGQVVTQDVDSFRRKAERDRAAAYAANRSAS